MSIFYLRLRVKKIIFFVTQMVIIQQIWFLQIANIQTFLNILIKLLHYIKYFFFNTNIYLNVIDNSNYLIKFKKNSVHLARECSEFFNIKFTHMGDTRNLLLEYSSKNHFLLKEFNLESYNNIKFNVNKMDFFKKNSIILQIGQDITIIYLIQ